MSEETAIPKPQGVLQGIAATESERGKSTGISSEEQLKRIIRNIVAESETKVPFHTPRRCPGPLLPQRDLVMVSDGGDRSHGPVAVRDTLPGRFRLA